MAESSTEVIDSVNGSSATEDLATSSEKCDFVIKVGDVSYPVHQKIILRYEHFCRMLAHDTKERQKGSVEIKEIDSQTMKLCIDFMYGRDIDVTVKTAINLLPAAEYLELTELSERCVGVLEKNLYSGNCITVLKLADAYSRTELAKRALVIFKKEFKMKNYEDFCKLDKEGIKQHIKDLDMEIAWDGIINWIKLDVGNRSSHIIELVNLLTWNRFPSANLLDFFWSEPLFKNCNNCRNLLFKSVFYKIKTLERSIDIENCLIIHKIASEVEILPEEEEQVIYDFMENNLVPISFEREFKSLSKETVLRLFSKAENGLCLESSHWNAAVQWMRNNPEQKESFCELLKCIRFDRMPKNFIRLTVKTEPMLSEIPELGKILLDSLGMLQNDISYVAILYPDGKIYAWNILDKTWRQLPDCPGNRENSKMFSFRGKLCVLTGGKLFYLGKNVTQWIPRAPLRHHLHQFFTLVASADKIYIVEKERTSCYDPDTNTWNESLPGCDLEGKLFGSCSSTYLFVRCAQGNRRYFEFETSLWREKGKGSPTTGNASLASNNNRIYSVGIHGPNNLYQKAKCYKNDSRTWKEIKETPVNVNKPSHLFFVDERLVLLVGGTFYSYDEVCNFWMTLDVLTPYLRGLGNVKSQEPLSVCSFRGNLGTISPINISK